MRLFSKSFFLFCGLSLTLGVSACNEDQEAQVEMEVDTSEPALGQSCAEDNPCPGDLSCAGFYGCLVPSCGPDPGRGEEFGCPSNGYCRIIDGDIVGCARLCEEDADCKAVNSNLSCGTNDQGTIAGFKFCLIEGE